MRVMVRQEHIHAGVIGSGFLFVWWNEWKSKSYHCRHLDYNAPQVFGVLMVTGQSIYSSLPNFVFVLACDIKEVAARLWATVPVATNRWVGPGPSDTTTRKTVSPDRCVIRSLRPVCVCCTFVTHSKHAKKFWFRHPLSWHGPFQDMTCYVYYVDWNWMCGVFCPFLVFPQRTMRVNWCCLEPNCLWQKRGGGEETRKIFVIKKYFSRHRQAGPGTAVHD